DEANDRGDERPTEQQVNDTLTRLAQIKLVYTDPAKENREQPSGQLVPIIWRGRQAARPAQLPHAALGADFCLCTDDSATFVAESFIRSFFVRLEALT
ncbi:MAG: hypothetical protein WAN10_16870, partial [Candidatus Acidiferrales bacterium]